MLKGMFDENPEAAASLTEVKLDSDKETETHEVEAVVAEGDVADIKASGFLTVEGKKDTSEEGSGVMPLQPLAFCIGPEEGSREMPLEPVAFCLGAKMTHVKSGLTIEHLIENGASARAGVRLGDILLAINGKSMRSFKETSSFLMLCSNDNSVRLTLRSKNGNVRDLVVLCNTAVTAAAKVVQREAASTPEICGTVPTDALVQGKDEKLFAKWTQATYNYRADAGEEGCAAAANIGVGAARVALTGTGAGPTERRDLENSHQATTPEPAPRSNTMATGRCLNPTEVIQVEGSATDSETIASSKKTDIKAESTLIKRKFVDVSSLNSQASLLENFEVYISLNICVFWCSFDICIECINKCLICIFFHLYRQLHRTDLTQFNII